MVRCDKIPPAYKELTKQFGGVKMINCRRCGGFISHDWSNILSLCEDCIGKCDHKLSFNLRDDSTVRCGLCGRKWDEAPQYYWVNECPDDCTVHSDTSTDDNTFHDDITTNWDNVPQSYTTCK